MKDRKEYKPSKDLSVITQNKKIATGIIIGVYLGVEFLLFFLFDADLENAYYISQLIGGVFIVAGLVVSVLQYTATNIDNWILRDKEKKIKAAEMANEFQREIIPLSNTLAKAYKMAGLDKTILKRITTSELIMFDKEEVENILKESKVNMAEVLVGLYVGYLLGTGKAKDAIIKNNGQYEIREEYRAQAESEIDTCINQLSNKLEYFGICFNSGIADEDTVYQSLHNVFFNCVYMLYLFMFGNNTTECDRLFSNVSSLYTRWHARYMGLVEEENQELMARKKEVQKKK